MDTIVVLDFGGQTAQLIARRIREIGVYSEIVPCDTALSDLAGFDVKGFVMSGSPYSVYETGAPEPHASLYAAGVPILGICYGFQRMSVDFGGKVESHGRKEYGRAAVNFDQPCDLFSGVNDGFTSWMSHGDSVTTLAPDFTLVGHTGNHISAAVDADRRFYGIQFHPEVSHCEFGNEILSNFAIDICGAKTEWNMDSFLSDAVVEIRDRVGREEILLLISGGVDSTVVAGLLLHALDSSSVHLMYIDTGLMRKDETREVEKTLKALGAENLYIIDAGERFLSALAGVDDPEEKRRIIGDMFIEVQEHEISERSVAAGFLAQGTLYTDMIESGKGVGTNAHVIKSHHNVRSPLVERKRAEGMIVEPLARLYKDEVRELGRHLHIDEAVVGRHPFPGPGLAVRILGAVTELKCDILREADAIFIDELKIRNLYNEIWQAFCVLLPVKSVGVTGDTRDYGFVVALRAIVSRDGMTADVYPFDTTDLLEISARITNEVKEVGRVVYDISSKPPATIEWE